MRPEPITSDVPGSLAWHVWHERHPALFEQIIAAHPYPASIADALRALLDETLHGSGWLEVPFLAAESRFYHRLLAAVRFFDDGPWRGVDPFAFLKTAELASAPLSGLAELSIVEAMYAALWGNQADLGFRIGVAAVTGSGVLGKADHLVVDDTSAAVAALGSARRIALVADNSGRELLAGGGIKRAAVTGSGIFKDAASDAKIRELFFAGTIRDWQLIIPDFGAVEGPFQIVALEFAADHAGEVTFEIALESAGEMGFTTS